MPKREQYEADGGFVEDAPKSKKRRSAGNELKSTEGKSTVNTDMQKDQEGNEYWEISRTRRVQLSDFKGTTMIAIREYYEKDDQMLPGKKGINLPVDQFAAVLDVLPQIESALKSKGVIIPRPKYAAAVDGAAEAEDDEAEDEGDGEDTKGEDDQDEANEKPLKSSKKQKKKANHEATDEEDE